MDIPETIAIANDNDPFRMPTDEEIDAAEDQLEVLRALIGELRERLAPLTPAQWDYVGMYMLKAVRLGEGKPAAQVLAHG